MLGLQRGMVKLVPHNKNWKYVFEKEKKVIKKSLGDLHVAIEHIGSTAVPGLPAKPILDIDVGVKTIKDFMRCVPLLSSIGYVEVKNKNSPHVHRIFAKGSSGKTIQYLHLIKYNGAVWNHDIAFRDRLKTDKKTRQAYTELKRRLAKEYPENRMLYTKNKADFVARMSRV